MADEEIIVEIGAEVPDEFFLKTDNDYKKAWPKKQLHFNIHISKIHLLEV